MRCSVVAIHGGTAAFTSSSHCSRTGIRSKGVFIDVALETFTADVTVISTRRIVQAHVEVGEEADGYWAKATSRRAVRSVVVEGRIGLIEREPRRDWPAAAAVVVHIAGLSAPLRLAPSAHSTWGGQTPDMHALLNLLLRNLD
jgi:hypothetical protein